MVNNSEISSMLWIRFVGDRFDDHSIPIYDLAQTFIAVQRIVNKAYLFKENRLLKGQKLNQKEQELVSLQLKERQRGSDIYGLTSFLSNPLVSSIVMPLVLEGLLALSSYAYKKVTKKHNEAIVTNQTIAVSADQNDSKFEKEQVFSGLIYPQVKDITTRINGTSGIKSIEFSFGGKNLPPISFDRSTKEYVNQIGDDYFLGEKQELTGVLHALQPSTNQVTIRKPQNNFVKVYLNDKHFEQIRYGAERDDIITLSGRPMYKLGIETTDFSEFEAYDVKIKHTKK